MRIQFGSNGLKITNHSCPSLFPLLLPSRLGAASPSAALGASLEASSVATAGFSSCFYYLFLGLRSALSPRPSLPSLGLLLPPLASLLVTSGAFTSRLVESLEATSSPSLRFNMSLVSVSMVT